MQCGSSKSGQKMQASFVDLFCGIGGFHLGLTNAATALGLNARCVAAAEINKHARKAYSDNFEHLNPEMFSKGHFYHDVSTIDATAMPDMDIICGGFPCQAFSKAGLQKGFDDPGRGNLFFSIAAMASIKRPKVLFLENVKNLVKHDEGNTFRTIRQIIESLGYWCHWKVLKASDFGLPQFRPRTYIVAFRKDLFDQDYSFPAGEPPGENGKPRLWFTMRDVFEAQWCDREIGYTLRVAGRHSPMFDRHNWDGYRIRRSENGPEEHVRVTPSEGLLMLGYPANWKLSPSESQAMKQLGNSVAIPVIEAIAKTILVRLQELHLQQLSVAAE